MNKLLVGLDLGTTSLAGQLWDADGKRLASARVDNPQQIFGADVIQRLEAARQGDARQLQQQMVAGINQLLNRLLSTAAASSNQIAAAAAAANPALSHLLAGQPVGRILFPPHHPAYLAGDSLDSPALGIDLPIPLQMLPLVSGYVGGDLVALLFGSPPADGPTLYLDLGTNAELALWDGKGWLVTSVAAGPAFEAAHLSCGMRHEPGAVIRVSLINERLALEVVDGGLPRGLCGSGLFSAIGTAIEAGLITIDGRIRSAEEIDSNLARYLHKDDSGQILQLYRDALTVVRITQQDLRAFQLAKGAVAAGVKCLLQRRELLPEQIVSVRLAGALGTALPVTALKGVAMLPEIMLEKCLFLGDGVLDGIRVFLTDRQGKSKIGAFSRKLLAFPLSGTRMFEDAFLTALDFG